MNKILAKKHNLCQNPIGSKVIRVNAENPDNGKTLSIYAVIIGEMDLVNGNFVLHSVCVLSFN